MKLELNKLIAVLSFFSCSAILLIEHCLPRLRSWLAALVGMFLVLDFEVCTIPLLVGHQEKEETTFLPLKIEILKEVYRAFCVLIGGPEAWAPTCDPPGISVCLLGPLHFQTGETVMGTSHITVLLASIDHFFHCYFHRGKGTLWPPVKTSAGAGAPMSAILGVLGLNSHTFFTSFLLSLCWTQQRDEGDKVGYYNTFNSVANLQAFCLP